MMFVCARCSSCLFKEKKNPILFICRVRRLTRQTWKSHWLQLKALFALMLWQLLTNCFFVSSFAKEWASIDWILIRFNSLLFLFWAKSHALEHVTHCKKYIIYCSFFCWFFGGNLLSHILLSISSWLLRESMQKWVICEILVLFQGWRALRCLTVVNEAELVLMVKTWCLSCFLHLYDGMHYEMVLTNCYRGSSGLWKTNFDHNFFFWKFTPFNLLNVLPYHRGII